jgi:hypothetical protein
VCNLPIREKPDGIAGKRQYCEGVTSQHCEFNFECLAGSIVKYDCPYIPSFEVVLWKIASEGNEIEFMHVSAPLPVLIALGADELRRFE